VLAEHQAKFDYKRQRRPFAVRQISRNALFGAKALRNNTVFVAAPTERPGKSALNQDGKWPVLESPRERDSIPTVDALDKHPPMKPGKLLLYGLGFLLASAGASLVAWIVSLIMFSGITGPFGYVAWTVVCSPAYAFGVTEDLNASSVVSGVAWGVVATLATAAWKRRRV
jgi:hypothetical protein